MRASTSDAAMSEPWPPAFIRTAPPIEPGTPTAHSKPVSPARTVRRATTGSAAAPPARTTVPATSIRAKASPSTRATPGNPASATSRFEPLPTTRVGTPVAATAAATAVRSSIDRASTNRAAAPPTR